MTLFICAIFLLVAVSFGLARLFMMAVNLTSIKVIYRSAS
jgi:hypothetical protein